MTEQADFRLPVTGENWRHYKGNLYTVVGLARDDEGNAVVVYTEATWTLVQLAPIYTQQLGRFLQDVDTVGGFKPRFRYQGPRSERCQYIARHPSPQDTVIPHD